MHKLLIAALLAVFSTNVMAEWTKVSDTDNFTNYADFSTIRKSGNTVKMWDLIDFKVVQTLDGRHFLSMAGQDEFDCKAETTRQLAVITYSKNMRAGEVVFNSGAMHEEPRPISPGTEGETLFKVACGTSGMRDADARAVTAMGNEVAAYKAKIRAKILRNIVMSSDIPKDALAEFDVTLFSGGVVLNVKLVKSSGSPMYDRAVERAIKKSDPLPVPPEGLLSNQFRELRLDFSPNE